MPRFRFLFAALVLGLSGALLGAVPGGVSAVTARTGCRATTFVTNIGSGTVSTIGVKSRTKLPTDITVGSFPFWVAVTPDGKTAFVTNLGTGTVSTIDVNTRDKGLTDITIGNEPGTVAFTPNGKAAFVTNGLSDSVSTIEEMPDGSALVLVWFESPDPEKSFAELAQDTSDFAVWFRGRVKEISGVDLTETQEGGPDLVLDWRA
jgi:YVTN family beta-propeller protein